MTAYSSQVADKPDHVGALWSDPSRLRWLDLADERALADDALRGQEDAETDSDLGLTFSCWACSNPCRPSYSFGRRSPRICRACARFFAAADEALPADVRHPQPDGPIRHDIDFDLVLHRLTSPPGGWPQRS